MSPWFGPSEHEVILEHQTLDLAFGVICCSNRDRSRRNRRDCIDAMTDVFADMAAGKRLVLLGPYGSFMLPKSEWERVPIAKVAPTERERFLHTLRRIAYDCEETFPETMVYVVR